jgi:hypothetical protein
MTPKLPKKYRDSKENRQKRGRKEAEKRQKRGRKDIKWYKKKPPSGFLQLGGFEARRGGRNRNPSCHQSG